MTPLVPVQIRKTHIRRGKRYDNYFCALSLALRPLLGEGMYPWVTEDELVVESETGRTLAMIGLPGKAQSFVNDFDTNKSQCQPTTVYLPLPKEVLR